jgi:ABC-type taurine transport system substrate-binding protein
MEKESLLSLVEKRQAFVAEIDKITAEKKELDEMIENFVVSGTTHVGKWSISVIDSEVVMFDSTRFKKENPNLVARYNKTTKRHSLTIKELKPNEEQV